MSAYPYGGVPLDLPRRKVTIVSVWPGNRPGLAIWKASGRFTAITLDHVDLDGPANTEKMAAWFDREINAVLELEDTLDELVTEEVPSGFRNNVLNGLQVVAARYGGIPLRMIHQGNVFAAHGGHGFNKHDIARKWGCSGFHYTAEEPTQAAMALGCAWAAGLSRSKAAR